MTVCCTHAASKWQRIALTHMDLATQVLRVCQNQLASGRLEVALPFVLLLGNISRQQPQLLVEHSQRLKDCMQNFSVLSSEAAYVSNSYPITCLGWMILSDRHSASVSAVTSVIPCRHCW